MHKIALVTGANRGLGFETCRQLARLGFSVILTARDPNAGQEAAQILIEEGLPVAFQPLDVTRLEQVERLRDEVVRQYGRLDVLVNNAAVYLDETINVLDVPLELVETTLAVNFYGPFHLARAFIPLMRRNGYGRLVNVSSEDGSLAEMNSRRGATSAYRISKAALNALTRLVAGAVQGENIKVNSVCPGWVRTDMGGPHATRSVEEGVDTILWLATLPDDGPSGGFYRDRKPLPW